jgi:CheY-like chemotaxis protein
VRVNEQVILLVEDNPDDALLTARALQKGNIANRVVVMRDGQEALDYFECKGAYADRDPCVQPAVVLLDLKLPGIDGLEVLAWLRGNEETRALPVVVLTSSPAEDDVVRSYNLGVNSYIRKPVAFEEFVETVQQLGLYWMVLNVCPPRDRRAA